VVVILLAVFGILILIRVIQRKRLLNLVFHVQYSEKGLRFLHEYTLRILRTLRLGYVSSTTPIEYGAHCDARLEFQLPIIERQMKIYCATFYGQQALTDENRMVIGTTIATLEEMLHKHKNGLSIWVLRYILGRI
jgi:hypothetical protein